MVIISRIRIDWKNRKFFAASIRWKILLAFFVIVGASFLVAAGSITGTVSQFMVEQQSRDVSLRTEKLSEVAAPLWISLDHEELNRKITDSAGENGGRLLILDAYGKVQFDTVGTLCGKQMIIQEAGTVLAGKGKSDYGIHRTEETLLRNLNSLTDTGYLSCCAAALYDGTKTIGVLLWINEVTEMLNSLTRIEWQLGRIFLLIAGAALILAMILSRVLTNPITALSRTMRKMGKGDLSVRVPVKGSGELRELAENYNTMAAQLENLDQTRNQFVSNASHELKTPLTSMKILLESLIYQPDMPQELRNEFMQDMNQEIDRLTGIITDLLTLSKMDNHAMKINTEMVDMSALTEETVRLLQPMAEKRGQQLLGETEPGLMMSGDREKLRQVLYNLTDNALKYTPDKGMVRVTLLSRAGTLVWVVKDNGVGIPEEDQPHVFERFYRVDKARSRETGGTGLGLSIVRQLVYLHEGTIELSSQPGKGTAFTVIFPLKREREE